MIAPTIQIKPNIEIQPLFTIEPTYNNQVLKVVDFELYIFVGTSMVLTKIPSLGFDTSSTDVGAQILLNPEVSSWGDATLSSNLDNGVIIENENFYMYSTGDSVISGSRMSSLIQQYYIDSRGTTPTDITTSFTVSTSTITETTTYYTYTASNSITGSMSGRVYYQSIANNDSNTGFKTNNTVTLSQGASLQDVINSINPTATLENAAAANSNNKIILYYFDAPIPLDTVGSYTRTLYSRTNYLRHISHGTVTINITSSDTTPPMLNIPNNVVFVEQGIINNTFDFVNFFDITYSDNVQTQSLVVTGLTFPLDTPGTYQATVIVTDTSNNQTSQNMTVTVTSPTNDSSPIILLKPNQTLIINYTENQFPFGVTASKQLQDILARVTLSDDNLEPTYELSIPLTILDQNNLENVVGIRAKTSDGKTSDFIYFTLNYIDNPNNNEGQSYNPLTDMLNGIFGATLSMIFTIGTINILGFRLLDVMALIVLGAVVWFVAKAIRG